MTKIKKALFIITALFFSFCAMAQSTKDIVEVASGAKTCSTLVTALKAADLITTLKSKGPFTVFAPTNDAFAKLPVGTLDNLLKPVNKTKLAGILKYHVVSGKLTAKDVLAAIKKGNGKAVLTTVQGEMLTATVVKNKVILTDEKGAKATVTKTDLDASNGVIHIINAVLMPK